MALVEWLREPTFVFQSIFVVMILLIKFFIFKKQPTKPKFNLPPCPSKLPIIGNLHQLGRNPCISFRDLSQKYGPIFYLQLGQVPTVIISSARLAQEAMKTHDLAFSSRPKIIAAKYLTYNFTDIGFSPYGAYWRYLRKICVLELFSVRRVQSFTFAREEEVARLVRRIEQRPYPSTINLSKMLGKYANDIVCKVAFGREFLKGEDFHELLQEFQELLGGLSIGDFFPSMEFVVTLTGMKSRLVKTFKSFDQLFDRVVADHLNPNRKSDDESKDLVDVLLDIRRNGSDDMLLTMDNVKAIILDMFAAGTNTTFITLDWGMTELMMNPKALEKAQDEVRSVVGDKKVVLESDLPQLKYLKAVIKETLRLHPPAPVLLPKESKEHVKIDGYDIPDKTRVLVNAWAIGRDPESWEDPETFEPERFVDNPIDFKGTNFEFIPFGAGRRICPGITFGTTVVELALAQLLHSFDWQLPPGVSAKDLDMTEVFGITMHRKASLAVVAKPRFE